VWLTDEGRPISWWHHSPDNPIQTAYYGCSSCGNPIDKLQMLGSKFRCIKTGVWLTRLLGELPKEAPKIPIKIGLILPPMLRDKDVSGAVDIISKGLAISTDLIDWAQQELGKPTTVKSAGFNLNRLKIAINSTPPNTRPDRTYWGLDQGTKWHYLAVVRYHKPHDTAGLSDLDIYMRSIRDVRFLDKIHASDLAQLIDNCDGGCLDNEPDRVWAAHICDSKLGVFTVDQQFGLKQPTIEGQSYLGGVSYPTMKINTDLFQTMMLKIFNANSDTTCGSYYCLPKFDTGDLSFGSIARQLTSSIYDPNIGRWSRPLDKDDDLLKALMFADVRYYCDICDLEPSFIVNLMNVNI
jgi:hypothetical protein